MERRRAILHVDCNSFYASCEQAYDPRLRGKAIAVGGDAEQRHGIILAASREAKKYGVKTADVLWEARKKCPHIFIVTPNYPLYERYSDLVRGIFQDYTSPDEIEPFGWDEAWLDVTRSACIGNGRFIAEQIRQRVKEELGLTVSIGVADNKIFAKLGSDMKKPDAITEVPTEHMESLVWPLACDEMIYVGRATKRKLGYIGVKTIGDLAQSNPEMLHRLLGVNGLMLWRFANGMDTSPVRPWDRDPKSIGNSNTMPRDLVNDEDVQTAIYPLAESVAMRLRKHAFRGRVVEITVRDNGLASFTRQKKIPHPTQLAKTITEVWWGLFKANHRWGIDRPIRSLGVRVSALEPTYGLQQTALLPDDAKLLKMEALEKAMDGVRERYGYKSIQRAVLFKEDKLKALNPLEDNINSFSAFTRG